MLKRAVRSLVAPFLLVCTALLAGTVGTGADTNHATAATGDPGWGTSRPQGNETALRAASTTSPNDPDPGWG